VFLLLPSRKSIDQLSMSSFQLSAYDSTSSKSTTSTIHVPPPRRFQTISSRTHGVHCFEVTRRRGNGVWCGLRHTHHTETYRAAFDVFLPLPFRKRYSICYVVCPTFLSSHYFFQNNPWARLCFFLCSFENDDTLCHVVCPTFWLLPKPRKNWVMSFLPRLRSQKSHRLLACGVRCFEFM
jgi:hypothetical protein